MRCNYCGRHGTVKERWDSDPHGMPMCDDCEVFQEIQPRMCVRCNEYGLILRDSGVWICSDCGLGLSDEESIQEHRIASSAEEDYE